MLYISNSKIHWRGVFAKENICKDTLIEKIPYIEFKSDDIIKEFEKYTFGLKNGNICIMLSYSSLLNHSNEPNSIIKDGDDEYLYLYSLIDIKKDEELTIKYGENIEFSQ